MSASLFRPACLNRWLAMAGVLAGSACTPTLDWREVRLENSALTALFPCKPERRTRSVVVAGEPSTMQMLACAAGGSTFAASVVEIADPGKVSAAVSALREAAIGNIQGTVSRSRPFGLVGATPNPLAVRLQIAGRLPDGQAVEEHATFFVHGLRVYQAAVIGPAPDPAAVDGFVAGLTLSS